MKWILPDLDVFKMMLDLLLAVSILAGAFLGGWWVVKDAPPDSLGIGDALEPLGRYLDNVRLRER